MYPRTAGRPGIRVARAGAGRIGRRVRALRRLLVRGLFGGLTLGLGDRVGVAGFDGLGQVFVGLRVLHALRVHFRRGRGGVRAEQRLVVLRFLA